MAPRWLKRCARRLLSETYSTRKSRTAQTEQETRKNWCKHAVHANVHHCTGRRPTGAIGYEEHYQCHLPLPGSFVTWPSKDDLQPFHYGKKKIVATIYESEHVIVLGEGTYIAIYSESPSKHDGCVTFSSGLKGQHQAEVVSGLPKDCLRGCFTTTSNTT